MKVLVFTNLYPNNIWPNHGVFIKERMTHFAKLDGCEVKVVAPVPYFPPIKINWRCRYSQVAHLEIRDGIEVYHPRYLMTPKLGMSLYGLTMFISVLQTVRKVKRTFDFDLIDAHFVYPDGFAAVLLGRFFSKPVVVSARGSDINLYSNFPLIRRILRYTLRKTNRVIAVCQALKESVIDLGVPEDKIFVIPNGVDHRKFFPVPKEFARKRVGLPLEKKINSIDWRIPRKGFDLLIKALKLLAKDQSGNNLYLIIVGEGPSRPNLEELISSTGLSEHVRLAGSVPHQELYSWYSAADLFCLASDREGWPNVLLESLACGTPVVATNVWGVPEIVRSDKIGLLTLRDEGKIAVTIKAALSKQWDPDVITEFAGQCTWERAALSILHVFESIHKSKCDHLPTDSHLSKVANDLSA